MTLRNPRRVVASALGALTLVAGMAVAAQAAPLCDGKPATMVGTRGFDFLIGTPGPDVIVGRTGLDQIYGRGGNDTICGGKGDDFLIGGGQDDVLIGEKGSDDLVGEEGSDLLSTGPGRANTATGGPGDDHLQGADGLDLANFIDSREPVEVDLSNDSATGEGNDLLEQIDGAIGTNFDDVLRGDSGSNVLVGAGGSDRLFSGGNVGVLTPNPTPEGVDILAGDGDGQSLPGDDIITGEGGLNVAEYITASNGVTIDLEQGIATGEGADVLSGIQIVSGTFYDDTLIGDEGNNGFRAFDGDDVIRGGPGSDAAVFTTAFSGITADLVTGVATGEGSDSLESIEFLWGSQGPDTLRGDATTNSLFGFRGNDSLFGEGGADVLNGGKGKDTLDGGPDEDRCTAGETNFGCETAPAPTRSAALAARLLHQPLPLRFVQRSERRAWIRRAPELPKL